MVLYASGSGITVAIILPFQARVVALRSPATDTNENVQQQQNAIQQQYHAPKERELESCERDRASSTLRSSPTRSFICRRSWPGKPEINMNTDESMHV